jgi:hypothetical protein
LIRGRMPVDELRRSYPQAQSCLWRNLIQLLLRQRALPVSLHPQIAFQKTCRPGKFCRLSQSPDIRKNAPVPSAAAAPARAL